MPEPCTCACTTEGVSVAHIVEDKPRQVGGTALFFAAGNEAGRECLCLRSKPLRRTRPAVSCSPPFLMYFLPGQMHQGGGRWAEGSVTVKVGSAGFGLDAEDRRKDDSDPDAKARPREDAGARAAARDGDARTSEERSVEVRRIHERAVLEKKESNRHSTFKVPN